ncbi:MAG: RNase II stability modulator [Alphaproteobacteria bacterium ADurb.Bin438]|nr:MAG: RNase II stability modulator [Alphaproteobacteria bacterium ADurb.Bin438]
MSLVIIIFLSLLSITLMFLLYSMYKKNKKIPDILKNISNLKDINQKLKQELENERTKYKKYVDFSIPTQSKSIIVCVDAGGVITSTNSYAEEFYGFLKKEMIGRLAVGLIIPLMDSKHNDMRELFKRIAENPKIYIDYENEGMKKGGEKVWISWTNHTVHDENGAVKEIRLVGFDITPKKQIENEMLALSSYDQVTDVYNKNNIMEIANNELKRAIRYSRAFSIVVLRVQSSGLTLKSEVDDDFLKKIADACKTVTRTSDSIGRISDTEFLIILPETPIANVSLLLHRLRSKINRIISDEGKSLDVLISASDQKYTDDNIDPIITRAINHLKI